MSRRLSLRRRAAYIGASLGAFVLVLAVLLWVFGDALLNRYGKARAERAFAAAHPGSLLQLGPLDYSVVANRLSAQSATLSTTNTTLKAGRISLTGVRWRRLLGASAAWAEVLAQARLEATKLEVEFPRAHYRLRCARLRASVPDSELFAEATELRPLGGDEAFFAAHAFRAPRFQVVLPECRVLGLDYGEVLRGTSYRAASVHLSGPTLDALINRDKAPKPFVQSPLMVHEALSAIRRPVRIDRLSLTNGHLRYCERLVVGADPAVLTIGAVSVSVEGLANRGAATDAIQLRGQGDLMQAGPMKLEMTIPIHAPDFSLRYSGSMSAMDLTRLDAFLEIAEHPRIKSGRVQEAAFAIEVKAGHAQGRVRAIYRDLEMAVLDKETGSEKGLVNRVASFFTNVLKIRTANTPDAAGLLPEGVVNYRRQPDDEFQQFVWFALRTGVLDSINH